ncbi:hypothetical protein C4D60_Mb07t18770 [Musa balbisiana]|uniref:ENTH domain-containing protein n=1 Tax=Musa balbisiana TaxID=52838 RepID=A0A4S8JGK6_MUSBA|nr:hypothetical protein C4D60_Mb07t18770 [Musa balbisiana]
MFASASAAAATITMDAPFFQELRKQASYFLKQKIQTARLALTDVTPAQLLTEEATNGSSSAPDAKTMRCISRAAFEIDDYWRIVEILHKRFDKLDRRQWREPYKALILLDYLLTHGPGSIADEFQSDTEAIRDLGNIEYIDERGFDWGVAAREKTVRVLKLLEKGPHLKEERERARKISRGIQGFGSFNLSWSSTTVHRPELVDPRVHDAIVNSEKENSKRDAGIDRQIRRAAGTARRRPLQENSGYKNLATEGTASPATTKMHLPEESKPLLHY